MSDDDLSEWIQKCSEYVKECQSRDAEHEGRALANGQVIALRDEVRYRVQAAHKAAKALQAELLPLVKMARDLPFECAERHVMDAWRAAVKSAVSCSLILHDSLPKPLSRAMRYHQAAARLAVAYDSGPNAREIARRIIVAAGLDDDYSEDALSRWLRQARKD